jgi:hypothetical protein
MLDPFEPAFDDFKLPCHLIVAGAATVSAGLFYVPEGGKQPIQVTVQGDMTLGVSFNHPYTPFRLRDVAAPTQVWLGAGMYNLEVYPTVTFFEVLEINFKSLAAFKASVFVAVRATCSCTWRFRSMCFVVYISDVVDMAELDVKLAPMTADLCMACMGFSLYTEHTLLLCCTQSCYLQLGRNNDKSLGPVGEYEVVRIASAFAMDLNQMVAGITLLNAPIPMAQIINDFAGMYFPATFKFQLELHVSDSCICNSEPADADGAVSACSDASGSVKSSHNAACCRCHVSAVICSVLPFMYMCGLRVTL